MVLKKPTVSRPNVTDEIVDGLWSDMRRKSLVWANRIYDRKIAPMYHGDVREAFEVGWLSALEKSASAARYGNKRKAKRMKSPRKKSRSS